MEITELLKICGSKDNPTVSGRALHEALEIKTRYNDWFPRMCEYGFEEGKDFYSILCESTGGRPSTDHMITISMAKELCMIQHSEIGKKCRRYFIAIEDKMNDPDAVIQRGYELAKKKLETISLLMGISNQIESFTQKSKGNVS